MKNIFSKFSPTSFTAGLLVSLILSGGTISALAADGVLTLTATPVNVMVNGKVFTPTDSLGNPVLVFSHNGTTYAPVKALATAYGLNVGYNAQTHLVTVSSNVSGNISDNSFADNWQITAKPNSGGTEKVYIATYSGNLGIDAFKAWWKSPDTNWLERQAAELAKSTAKTSGGTVLIYFNFGDYPLGNALASSTSATANFDVTATWLK